MNAPIAALKKIGCKVVSRETTAGAMKWWLTYPRDIAVDGVRNLRRRTLLRLFPGNGAKTDAALNDGEFRLQGADVAFQGEYDDGHFGLFVSKTRKTSAGRSYRRGIDC